MINYYKIQAKLNYINTHYLLKHSDIRLTISKGETCMSIYNACKKIFDKNPITESTEEMCLKFLEGYIYEYEF